MKKKKKRRRSKGKKVSLPNDVAPITHCDDDNCYNIGAIHTINDESDYAYDMKMPKLGDAMFDEDDVFDNIFAEINVCPKLGDAMFNEDDIFSLPSFDEQIYYDDSMPPIYDDYCDDTYAIRNNDNHETCHHDFSFQLDYASHDNYFVEFAPTTIHEKKFAYVESSKFSMHVDHEKNALCDGYIVEFIHDATENYYEGGIYACRNCNNIKFPLYVLKVLKLCLFCLPMLVDYCSHKLFAQKIPSIVSVLELKCVSHILHDSSIMLQFLSSM